MSALELVDTHCHLNFTSYDQDRAEVLERARSSGVRRIIVPAIDLDSARQALALAEQHKEVFAAVGIHPNSCSDFQATQLDELRALAQHRSVVAIGEIGLDYYWDKCPKPMQHRALEAQLELAAALERPVILHNRQAAEVLIATLEAWSPSAPVSLRDRLGVLHSFSASPAVALRAVELGFYLGFTGPITYKNADELRDIAAGAPIERLLIETDAPFLSPQPRRGKRNEPAYLAYINERLAALRGISATAMARQTSANARRLFASL